MKQILTLAVFLFGTVANNVHAAGLPDAREVEMIIKCHEGKFTFLDAVGQLASSVNSERGYVVGHLGAIGSGTPNRTNPDAEIVIVKAPFTVSAPAFITIGDTPYACVTVQRQIASQP